MKQNLFFFLLFTGICSARSQESQNNLYYSDGRGAYVAGTAVTASDILYFQKSGVSDVFLYIDRSSKWSDETRMLALSAHNAVFTLSADAVSTDIWRNARKYAKENDNHTYYRGDLIYIDGGKRDSIEIFFDLAPAKPVLVEADFRYEGFDEEWVLFENTTSDMKLLSEGADRLFCCTTACWCLEEPGWREKAIFRLILEARYDNDTGLFDVSFDEWDYRELLYFYGYNKYGWSFNSDTLCTCDYITDPYIIDAFNNFELKLDVTAPAISRVHSVMVYNTNGTLVATLPKQDTHKLSPLPKGIYIIVIKDKNQTITKKIKI